MTTAETILPLPPSGAAKPFEPGTTGWTASDLDDPDIERAWFAGRYEIVEGVLTTMPAAYFAGSSPLIGLVIALEHYFKVSGPGGKFGVEVDIVINDVRVARADAVYLTGEQIVAQRNAALAAGRRDPIRTRILIPPLLVIESVSPGHEVHDRRTKRRWYAEFGIPNYWILDGFARTLQCLVLDGSDYRLDVQGGAADEIRPPAFPGLVLQLNNIWLGL